MALHGSSIPATGGETEGTVLLLEVVRVFWRQQGSTGRSRATTVTTPAEAEPRRGRSRRYSARLGLISRAFERWHAQEPNARTGTSRKALERHRAHPWRRPCSGSMADPARGSNRGGRKRGFACEVTLNLSGVVACSGRRWSCRNSKSIHDGRR